MTTEKHVVHISRQWHNPAITIEVRHEAIGISMPLSDFIKALASEVGNPIALVRSGQLERKLLLAADVITGSMKRETTGVV